MCRRRRRSARAHAMHPVADWQLLLLLFRLSVCAWTFHSIVHLRATHNQSYYNSQCVANAFSQSRWRHTPPLGNTSGNMCATIIIFYYYFNIFICIYERNLHSARQWSMWTEMTLEHHSRTLKCRLLTVVVMRVRRVWWVENFLLISSAQTQ